MDKKFFWKIVSVYPDITLGEIRYLFDYPFISWQIREYAEEKFRQRGIIK